MQRCGVEPPLQFLHHNSVDEDEGIYCAKQGFCSRRRAYRIAGYYIGRLLERVPMSTAKAERYARQARNCDTVEDVGDYMKRAVDELVEASRDLEARVKRLESKAR